MQVEGTRVYRVKAVAEMFAVSPATVYREIESGKLVAFRFGAGKGSLRITGEAINAYLAKATAARVWTDLTEDQAQGWACVRCGADFRATPGSTSVAVGRSATGGQVFACRVHDNPAAEADRRLFAIVTGEV
jgi:excisionase family DNA binding protein